MQTTSQLFNLAEFTCPVAESAAALVKAQIPTYRYRYFGDFDNMRLFNDSGAYHGSDCPQIFGTASQVSGVQNTPEEDALSSFMMKAWATFVKNPATGLEALGWPKYNPNS